MLLSIPNTSLLFAGTHILWFHANIFTELLHRLRTDHLVGAGVLVEPAQALFTGERLLSVDRSCTTDLRSGETTNKQLLKRLKIYSSH